MNPSHISEEQSQGHVLTPCAAPCGEKRLLFVGGKPAWFNDTAQVVRELRPGWRAQHVLNPAEAHQCLASCRMDVVVVHRDIEDAEAFLASISGSFGSPSTVSLKDEISHGKLDPAPGVESGQGMSRDSIEAAESVVRAVAVLDWTSQPAMKSLLERIKTWPTLPRLHLQITQELQSSNGSLEMVSQYVRKDPIMAAKFLQMINSASFGLSYSVDDPGEAVMFLGVVRTRALVLAAGVFSQFDEMRCSDFSPEQIWQHSLQVASLAQGVALLQTEDPKLAETAFTAGLLHDIGKLVLAGNMPEMYATAHRLQRFKRIQQAEAELDMLGSSHAELGGCLLASWRLPLRIVEAVAWHHKPSISPDKDFSVLTAVHAGNVLSHEMAGANTDISTPSRFDVFYLAKLGLTNRRNPWREGCGLPAKDDQDSFEDQVRRRLEDSYNQPASSVKFVG